MRLLIISLFISTLCFGQEYLAMKAISSNKNLIAEPYDGGYDKRFLESIDTTKKKPEIDSLEIKTISIKELEGYLTRISVVAMKQFDLTEKAKYDNIFKELQAIYTEADKKRKQK